MTGFPIDAQRRGREQLVCSNLTTIRRAQRLLDDLESMWSDRLDRLGQLLEFPTESDPS